MLNFKVPNNPFKEGQNIDITCEVARVKGNVSANNLRVFLGSQRMDGSLITENSDHTKKLLFDKTLHIKASDNGKIVTCIYSALHGIDQLGSFMIEIMDCKYFEIPFPF